MYYSLYNLILPIKKSTKYPYAIMNSLSGAFDLMETKDYERIQALKEGKDIPDRELLSYLLSRGYIYNSLEEEQLRLSSRWNEFSEALQDTPPQVLLVPAYTCNLDCLYCYQKGIKHKKDLISKETVDAFYDYLEERYPTKKPFITLFGGEPLNGSIRQKEIMNYIVQKAAKGGYPIAAVSNGFDLVSYLDLLQQAELKELQITLDGPKAVHDQRRHTAGGVGTYDRIFAGLKEAIERGIPINMRVVVDKTNYESLVELAEALEEQGWLDLPAEKFKTQIGRNYELFECYAAPQHLLGQAEHWAMFVELADKYPILKKLHTPEFKGIHYLVQTGELYLPSYDTCPACKTEWVFDLYGDIYGCTATTGQDEFKLGTFYPEKTLNQQSVSEWQERSILTIPECKGCEVSLICGGGCGAVAKSKTGKVLAPDCRPIKEILELGVNYYSDNLLNMGF
ncbi:MAG: radical SAM protein [Desulfitobacterium hafniense]|nr:radical SAM protein [Desulfitobacterium hafniense]